MGSVIFAVGLCMLIGTSVLAGRHWARSTFQAVLWGVGTAIAAVTVVAVMSALAFAHDPSSVNLEQYGINLMCLLIAGPFLGAAVTIGARRRVLSRWKFHHSPSHSPIQAAKGN